MSDADTPASAFMFGIMVEVDTDSITADAHSPGVRTNGASYQ